MPYAPYVTSLPWITHYGCKYVVHGDDITSDSSGADCYRYVKAAGRFKVVKRTPSISTTDLVGRMLLCTKTHFIKSLAKVLEGDEGSGTEAERKAEGAAMAERIKVYATDESGLHPGPSVWLWSDPLAGSNGVFSSLCKGSQPKPGQRVVYVGGGFDLFSSGHIAFLRLVIETEENIGKAEGWYSEQAVQERVGKGADYGPVFLVAGIHNDKAINAWKGINYPIMNIYERGLCVLQCKYVDAVIFGAPFVPTRSYLTSTPWGTPDAVYHGPTSEQSMINDRYAAVREMGIYKQLGKHDFSSVTASQIVDRIMKSRSMYEERQRKKGAKVVGEEAQKLREQMEEEQRLKEKSLLG